MATQIGNAWYTEDAEYTVSGQVITRGDGTYCVVDGDAGEIAESLANGDASDDEYDWSEPV